MELSTQSTFNIIVAALERTLASSEVTASRSNHQQETLSNNNFTHRSDGEELKTVLSQREIRCDVSQLLFDYWGVLRIHRLC